MTTPIIELADVFKVGACAALATAVFSGLYALLADDDGPVRRAWALYVGGLDDRLRAMFLPPTGSRIAMAQLAIIGAVIAGALLWELPYWYALVAVAAIGPKLVIESRRRKRIALIERQLDPFILALANALKSIPSVSAAFQSVVDTSPSPIREEIDLCTREMRVGSTLDEVLLHMAGRVKSARFDSVLSAIVLGRRVGGNLPRVLENTAASIREVHRLEAVLRTKTAEAKMQLYVIGATPLVMLSALSFISPGYFNPLAESALGTVVGLAAAGCWITALVLARKILAVAI
jgi:tight adherence protein B